MAEPPLPLEKDVAVAAYANADDGSFSQAGALYRPMNEDPKAQLVANIAGGLSRAGRPSGNAWSSSYAPRIPTTGRASGVR